MAVSENTIREGLKPLLTKPETAKFYAVTQRTIDRWLLEGTLPADAKVIIGGSVRFRTAVLMAHISGNAGGEA
jgi:predicted DNA-binding transcriptional regulator AlpA